MVYSGDIMFSPCLSRSNIGLPAVDEASTVCCPCERVYSPASMDSGATWTCLSPFRCRNRTVCSAG